MLAQQLWNSCQLLLAELSFYIAEADGNYFELRKQDSVKNSLHIFSYVENFWVDSHGQAVKMLCWIDSLKGQDTDNAAYIE